MIANCPGASSSRSDSLDHDLSDCYQDVRIILALQRSIHQPFFQQPHEKFTLYSICYTMSRPRKLEPIHSHAG